MASKEIRAMKNWQKVSATVIISLLLVTVTACSLPGKASTDAGAVTVERGTLTVSIPGSGNLATQREARLSFRTAGKIAGLLHKEGDQVAQGTALALLETDSLALAKKQAEVDLSAAQAALAEAEQNHGTALLKAQISLDEARYNLQQTQKLYSWSDISTAQAGVDEAQRYLEYCQEQIKKYIPPNEDGTYPDLMEYALNAEYQKIPGYKGWQEQLVYAQSRLNTAKDRLEAMLSGNDTLEVAIKKKQVEMAELALAQAEKDQSIVNARHAMELAQQSLELAQKNLDEATIAAPFDGVVASVQAKAGDMVSASTLVVSLVKTTLLELIVEVDEMDVPKVAVGQAARISVDALPGKDFTGKVTAIYPVPAKVTGLVMYNVKIALAVPEGLGLQIGMRTTANIVVDERNNVLKVPSQFVNEDGQGGHFVKVMVEKKTESRMVTVGVDNDTETEITSGLNEGELVIR